MMKGWGTKWAMLERGRAGDGATRSYLFTHVPTRYILIVHLLCAGHCLGA